MKQADQEREKLAVNCENLTKEKQDLSNNLTETKDELNRKTKEFEEKKVEYEKEKSTFDSEIMASIFKVDSFQSAYNEANKQLETFKEQHAEAQNLVKSKGEKVTILESKVQDMQKKLDSLSQTV